MNIFILIIVVIIGIFCCYKIKALPSQGWRILAWLSLSLFLVIPDVYDIIVNGYTCYAVSKAALYEKYLPVWLQVIDFGVTWPLIMFYFLFDVGREDKEKGYEQK